MPASAPRYSPRLLTAIERLDDERLPIAEVCRRVAADAEANGLPRPSYVHVRRYVRELRARRAGDRAARAVLLQAAGRAALSRYVNAYEVAGRMVDAREEASATARRRRLSPGS